MENSRSLSVAYLPFTRWSVENDDSLVYGSVNAEAFNHAENFSYNLYILLLLIDIVPPFASDSLIPNLPSLSDEFNATHTLSNLSIQCYWLSMAFGGIVMGYLAQRVGKRKTIIAGYVIFTIASMGCTIAQNVTGFVIFRCFQGFSGAVGNLAPAIVRDLVDNPRMRTKYISTLESVKPIGMLVGPILGGAAGEYRTWRWNFAALSLMGILICIWSYISLPDTLVQPRNHWQDVKRIWCNVWFIGPTLSSAIHFGGFTTFIVSWPYYCEDYFDMSPIFFGVLMGSVSLFFAAGALLINMFSNRLNPLDISIISSYFMPVTCFLMGCSGFFLVSKSWYYLYLPTGIWIANLSMFVIPLEIIELEYFKEISGLVSSHFEVITKE